jgi:hypothetical protein
VIQQTNAVLRGKYDMHMTAERYISDDADSLRMAADLSETREFGEAPSDCGRRFFLFGENGMSPNSLSASRTGVDRCYRNGIYNVYTVRGDDKAAVEIQIRRETWKYSL